ncbi:MAG: SEC-C metal-binding domain-containing protein [Bacteroidota bacterium]|nr:SEC-C metal-binding domain-containing protein [Bacteroidota bacterium]
MKKIGRNDSCPCGSGLKYKKCCLEKGAIPNAIIRGAESNPFEKKTIRAMESVSKSIKIADEDGNGFYRIFWDDTVEKVNPIEYYKQFELQKRVISYRDILEMKHPDLFSNLSDDFFIRFAQQKLNEEKFWEIKEQTEVHDNFLKLLETNKKKEQVALLKGLSINPDQLLSLIFKSYKDYGFLYSRYRIENLPKGIERKKKPKIADISDCGNIKTIGKTDLTKGEVKSMIEQRKVIVAHFFDKGENWHCLFTTYHSLEGKESWKDGQAHFHYFSNAFGITRGEFIESIKSGQHKSTPIHIDMLGYGNQTIIDKK